MVIVLIIETGDRHVEYIMFIIDLQFSDCGGGRLSGGKQFPFKLITSTVIINFPSY